MESKGIAKEWYWGDAGVYTMPLCPTCHDVTYSEERCPFCGQLLKDPIQNIRQDDCNK